MGLFDNIKGSINSALDRALNIAPPQNSPGIMQPGDLLQKTLSPTTEELRKRHYEDGSIGRKGLIVDPFFTQNNTTGLFRQKKGSMHNELLKLAARADAVVSTIINTRANEVMAACRKQNNHYDIGFKVRTVRTDIQSDPAEVERIEDYIFNCGMKENRHDSDKLTLDRLGYMISCDFLRYGYCSIEKDWTEGGTLHSFGPLPAETIYYANPYVPDDVYRKEAEIWESTQAVALRDYEPLEEDDQDTENPIEYVQIIQGRDVANFTKKELIFCKYVDDNDIDLNGYAISPLEKAIQMVTNHLKVDNHQSMFFTHGMASRGILVIQGDVTPNNLRTLQAQWTQQVAGGQNAWRTPVLGGIDGVQWVSLQPSNRDMEFAAYQDYLLRTIHACFAISPVQTGFEYLSRGTEQRSMGESSNEWKLTDSRDRGLRPILNRIEMIINEEVLPAFDKALSEKYHFCFVGLDAETRTEETTRLSAEVSLHTTLNEARAEVKKEPMPVGGNLILNPLLIQTLMQSMPFGMWVEMFIGIEGASQRPDLQFFCRPEWFQWQTMQMQVLQQQAASQMSNNNDQSEDEEKEEKPKKESKDGEGGIQRKEDDQAEEQARQQAESMSIAANQYIQANPELFKSMHDTLEKSEALHRKVNPIANHMIDQYRDSSRKLIEEIMKAIEEEAKK